MATLSELGIDYRAKAAHIVIATKALVDALLAMNTRNRAVKLSQVLRIRQDIDAGKFILTNQGIGVSVSGVLNDGQHRLISLRDAGYPPVELLIVTGLADEAQALVDQQAKRSQADVVSLLLNQTTSTKMIAVINAEARVNQKGDVFSYTKSEVALLGGYALAEIVVERGETIASIIQAAGSESAFVCAALLEYAKRTSMEQAIDFADKLKRGVGLSENDPVYRLREAFVKRKTEFAGGAQGRIRAYSATTSACIAHSRREPLQFIRAASSWDRVKRWG